MRKETINHSTIRQRNTPSSIRRYTSARIGGLRLLSRLVIGSISLGFEELNSHLVHWNEQQIISPDNFEASTTNGIIEFPDKGLSVIQTASGSSNSQPSETSFAVIGMMMDIQSRVQSGLYLIGRIGKLINQATIPLIRPINRRWLPRPLSKGLNKLVIRGENEIQQWVITGKNEYLESRKYVQVAMKSTFNESVDNLAQNPEIRELIQSQGVSLAGELVEEIRERTVSADNFLETVAREMLRRKPRVELPPPSDAVIKSASPRRNYISK